MNRFLNISSIVFVVFLTYACAAYKDIVYFQNIGESDLVPQTADYEAVIQRDDRLSIVVSGPDKSVTAPYNLTLSDYATGGVGTTNPESATLSYLVDKDGDIEFPILGRIHVAGMTRTQLVDYLTREIGKDVLNPVIYVSFKNYKITVLGEVLNPGTYTMDSERISILQALGRAGDLKLTAKREGILLLREVDGKQRHYVIDLKDAGLLDSPFFYLQQNDVLVVPASPTRVKTATTATGIWSVALTSVTTTIALITMILSLTNR